MLLKAFQRLGYFPRLQDVPFPVLAHIRSCLRLSPDTTLEVTPRTLYKHHQAIGEFLQVTAWGSEARHVAIAAVHQAAQAKDGPADLINVAIEELVRQRCELPAGIQAPAPHDFRLDLGGRPARVRRFGHRAGA